MKKLYLSDDPVFCFIVFEKEHLSVVEIFDFEEDAISYVNEHSELDWRALNITHLAHCFQFEVNRLISHLLDLQISSALNQHSDE